MSKTVDKDAKQLATKRGMPVEGAPWKLEHDQVFFRRYTRLLQSAPPAALRRMSPYLGELMSAAIWERENAQAQVHQLKALAEMAADKERLSGYALPQSQPAQDVLPVAGLRNGRLG